jgi:tetratricopeptide (TPR) repeat protein
MRTKIVFFSIPGSYVFVYGLRVLVKWIIFGLMSRIEQIGNFLKDSPNDCFLKHALALEYIKAGDDDRALQLFEENRAFDPAYIATYYHMGKLLERQSNTEAAILVYTQGMEYARAAGDNHAYSELRSVHEELIY